MKVLVGVKRVIDYSVKVRIKPDGNAGKGAVDLSVKMNVNPFCELAIEEAVRLKEKKIAKEIIAVTVGPKAAQEQLRTALAMGCDRAIHIDSGSDDPTAVEPLAVAKCFKALVEQEKADLVIVGKQAIDDDTNAVGQMLAGLMDWPQATYANELKFDGGKLTVAKEIDTGVQNLEMKLPAVITADLRLNEPRYATLPNIMKAKKKKIDNVNAADLGVDLASRLQLVKMEDPPVRQAGVKVDSVDAVISKLKADGLI